MTRFPKAVLPVLVAAALGGCANLSGNFSAGEFSRSGDAAAVRALAGVRLDAVLKNADSTDRKIVAEGLKALKEGNLERASRIFNAALKLNVTSSDIHLLNALTYHLMALNGDTARFEMAEEGYRIALRFEASNWLADYQLGLCYLDQRKYGLAQAHLARAATSERSDPDLLYDLAVASYYAGDPRVAEGALKRLREIAPVRARTPDYMRTAVMTQAALNDPAGVMKTLAEYRGSGDAPGALVLERRIDDWGAFYRSALAAPVLAQFAPRSAPPAPAPGGFGGAFAPPPPGALPPPGGIPGASPPGLGPPVIGQPGLAPPGIGLPGPGQQAGAPTAFVDDKMVVVDIVLIATQDDSRETYGINLLNGLRLQFGDPLTNTPGLGRTLSSVRNEYDSTQNAQTLTITRNMRLPSVTYSLNIANALNDRDEIIAKPSLVALSGQTSDFFSGTEISAAAVSGGAGDSVSIQKEIGIKLAVRPDFLPDGKIRLQVAAQRTFLTDPSSSVVFQFRLDTSKTTVNANVVLRFGETLVLSGLTESENTIGVSGVPLLRDIPGLNLLFSQRDRREFRKSVLILLTPRRPLYSAQAPQDRQAELEGLSEYERGLSQLESRNADWFRPRSIADEVREQLNRREFLREFRMGDVKSERWDKRDSHGARLNQAIGRLFL